MVIEILYSIFSFSAPIHSLYHSLYQLPTAEPTYQNFLSFYPHPPPPPPLSLSLAAGMDTRASGVAASARRGGRGPGSLRPSPLSPACLSLHSSPPAFLSAA